MIKGFFFFIAATCEQCVPEEFALSRTNPDKNTNIQLRKYGSNFKFREISNKMPSAKSSKNGGISLCGLSMLRHFCFHPTVEKDACKANEFSLGVNY